MGNLLQDQLLSWKVGAGWALWGGAAAEMMVFGS